MKNNIMWEHETVRLNIDIGGKTIGDSVPSPISAKDLMELEKAKDISLRIKLNDVEISCSNYYKSGEDELAQYVFLINLPEIEGLQLGALILVDDEFTLIGAQPTPPTPPTPTPSEPPYVEEDEWLYAIYDDGIFEAWYYLIGDTLTITEASGNLYRSETKELPFPTAITDKGEFYLFTALVQVSHNNYSCVGAYAGTYESGIKYQGLSGKSRTLNRNYRTSVYVTGRVIS